MLLFAVWKTKFYIKGAISWRTYVFFRIIIYNNGYYLLEMDYQTSVDDHQTNAYSYNAICSLESQILYKESYILKRVCVFSYYYLQ